MTANPPARPLPFARAAAASAVGALLLAIAPAFAQTVPLPEAPTPAASATPHEAGASAIPLFDPDMVDEGRELVKVLAEGDAPNAERRLFELAVPGAIALGEALASPLPPAAFSRLRRAFRSSLTPALRELDQRAAALIPSDPEAGASTSTTTPSAGADASPADDAAIAKTVRAEIRLVGLAMSSLLLAPGGGRDDASIAVRRSLLMEQFEAVDRQRHQAPSRLATRLVHLGPLARPLLLHLAQGDPAQRAFAEDVRARSVDLWIKALRGDDPLAPLDRSAAREALFGLADLAEPELRTLAETASPDVRHVAAELLQQIDWRISDALYEKTGDLFYDFANGTWQARRLRVFELEKLGGEDAIATLRQVLVKDPSESVRWMAAESLARLSDPIGLAYLRRTGRSFLRQSPEVVAAIAMSQGIRYLQIRRYGQALREFERVLKIQPHSSTALYNVACTYALMGKLPEALDFLDRAIDAGFDDVKHMLTDSDLDNLHDEPRFKELEAKLRRRPGG